MGEEEKRTKTQGQKFPRAKNRSLDTKNYVLNSALDCKDQFNHRITFMFEGKSPHNTERIKN